MRPVNYRFATAEDAPCLAAMNRQLIADEGHRNPMSPEELRDRMAGWLASEYQAVLFEESDDVVGYALFRREPDYVYVRQFFVVPHRRRQRIGQAAFAWLLANVWQDAARVCLDVLVGNQPGIRFWKSLWFEDYCITLERDINA